MNDALAHAVAHHLLDRRWTMAAAESCTGGLLLHRMTNIPGSSAYVMGGVVAYDNAVKRAVLGVQESTLIQYGAVSDQTAVEMAQGILRLMQTDCAVSVTGIAGPGGGTAEKPVGLAHVAVVTRAGVVRVTQQVSPGDRVAVKAASADAALRLLLDVIADDR